MQLDNVNILKYNLVSELNIDFQDGINIVFGPNGSGKSLIIKAITKLLVGKDRCRRSEEYPLGNMEIRDETNILDFDGKRTIESCFPIFTEDLENIYVITDGFSEIEDEKEFYQKIIPRLIGLQISDIETIMENLLSHGRMSSPGRLSNHRKYNKPAKQLREAKKLIPLISTFLEDESSKGKLAFFYEISNLKRQRKDLKENKEQMEQAKRVQQLRKLEKHINEAEKTLTELKELEKPEINTLKASVHEYRSDSKDYEDYQLELDTWQKYTFIFLVISLVPLILVSINSSLYFLGFSSFLGILGLIWCAYGAIGTKRKISKRKGIERKILHEAKGLWPNKSTEDIEIHLSNHEKQLEHLNAELQQRVGVIQNSDILELPPLKALNFISVRERVKQEQSKVDMQITLDYSEEEYSTLRKELSKIEDILESFQQQEKEFTTKFQKVLSKCNPSNFDFEEVLGKAVEWELQNIETLEWFLKYLKEYVEAINRNVEIHTEAHEIFERILEIETQKIAEFFNNDTKVSEFIHYITNGLFKEINYEPESGTFLLLREGDVTQNIDELSRGEFSQLYFTVRLALGIKCVDQGFLILEDPFLASDHKRFEAQVEILKRFVNSGWQVIFFTAQEYVKDELLHAGGTLVKKLDRITV